MKKALVGFGGHAREVMSQMGIKLTCFVDDNYVVDGTLPLSKFNPTEYALMIAVANSKDRFNIVQKLPKSTKYFTWIHPTALILDTNIEIGEGSFIGAYSVLTTNIKIGNHAILNRGNHVGHDCKIGNYFSAMPNAVVGGNVTIGNNVYLGSCSNIREKITISNNITIGMNAAVVTNLTDEHIYVGIPAKKL